MAGSVPKKKKGFGESNMSTMRLIVVGLILTTLVAAWKASSAPTGTLPVDPRDVPREMLLSIVETKGDITGGNPPKVLILVNALTGNEDPAKAGEVMFGIAEPGSGKERGALLWSFRIAEKTGLPAHDGEMTVVDFDGDGRSEILLIWDRSISGENRDRWAAIYSATDPTKPRKVWEGSWERDTRRDSAVPQNRREWFRREVDFGATRREAGKALVFRKTQYVEGGQKLDPPRVEPEWVTAPLRLPASP